MKMIKEVEIGEKCAAEKCKRNRLMEEKIKRMFCHAKWKEIAGN